jgi:4-amino-4-deoxy-L-arabinose transferase-like glycosyltransferase
VGKWTPYLLLALVALALRLPELGRFVTIDEAKFWIPRSERFLQSLQTADYAHMPMVGHPGITTMWLGSAGISLRRILYEQGILQTETYSRLLMLHRLPTVLTHSVMLLVGYALLQKLASPTEAWLAALLWATDPFVLAFSRILHVDALAGTFATVSLLAAWVAWQSERRPYRYRWWLWLILSGICAGAAIMSKLPALALLPPIGLLALGATYNSAPPRPIRAARGNERGRGERGQREREQGEQRERGTKYWHMLTWLLLWGIVCMATMVVLTPMAWVDPLRVVDAFRYGIESEGGEPHMWGNFFLGQPVDVPGTLFYPVALALRTTPWTLAGLLLLPWALRYPQHTAAANNTDNPPHRFTPQYLALVAGFILLFVIAMSLFPKKMNRYLVPIFPALDMLAACGLVWGAGMLAQLVTAQWRGWVERGILALVALVAIGNAALWLPYNVAYANQWLGGAPAGARTFLTGWGEGMEQAAAWLNEQPDITSVVTLTSLRSVLSPYLRDGAYATSDELGRMPSGTGYAIIYLSHLQRGLTAPYADLYQHTVPIHTVQVQGVPYVWIYQVPRPMPYPLLANFGENLRVQGYAIDTTQLQASSTLTLTLQWQTQAVMDTDYMLFMHIFDERGQQVGQLDVPLLDPRYGTGEPPVPTSAWQPGRVFQWQHPVHLPTGVPDGTYTLGMGVYDPSDWSRLPLDAPPPPPGTPDDGDHVLFLEPLVVQKKY